MTSGIAQWTIDPARLWPGAGPVDAPVALVDLRGASDWPPVPQLPPCPLIGFGDPDHPLADRLDCLVEPPAVAEGLVRNILAMPRAAAVIVQLLRIVPELGDEPALVAESIAYGLLQGSDEHRAWLAARADATAAQRMPGQVAVTRAGTCLTIALDSPASGNAIDRHMRDRLDEALTLASLDEQIARVVLRANGRTFSLGAELGEFGTTSDPATAHMIRSLTLPARAAVRCAGKTEAHVQGGCVGAGLELAAWARRLVAASGAWFQLPELAMGILPGAGGCVSLTRRIGRQRTALMVLSGKRISARVALDWGLADAVVDELPGD